MAQSAGQRSVPRGWIINVCRTSWSNLGIFKLRGRSAIEAVIDS
jgi:hypothetical protein